MKKYVKKYIKENEKRTLKILKKMFGIKNIPDAIKFELELRTELESFYKKDIELINWTVVKSNYNSHNGYIYAKYLTIHSIINSYIENKKLNPYTNDLEEIENDNF